MNFWGHFSQPDAVDTVSAVVNGLIFLRFEKQGDATPFSFEKPVVGHEETDEEVHSSIDFCFCCFNVSSPRKTTTKETTEQVAHEKGSRLVECLIPR